MSTSVPELFTDTNAVVGGIVPFELIHVREQLLLGDRAARSTVLTLREFSTSLESRKYPSRDLSETEITQLE